MTKQNNKTITLHTRAVKENKKKTWKKLIYTIIIKKKLQRKENNIKTK